MNGSHDTTSPYDGAFENDILLTDDQIDAILFQLRNQNVLDIHRSLEPKWPSIKWPLPITYKFDGTYSE